MNTSKSTRFQGIVISLSLSALLSVSLLCGTARAQEVTSPQAAVLPAATAQTETPKMVWNDPLLWGRGHKRSGMNDFLRLNGSASRGDVYAVSVLRSRDLAGQGKYSEAFAEFARAASIQPKHAPYDEWADALEASGDRQGALRMYREKALREAANPTPDVYMRYALLLEKDGQIEAAIEAYRQGYENARMYAPRFQDQYAQFDPGQVEMSVRSFRRTRPFFVAAAHTIIGLTCGVERTSNWPGLTQIAEYEKAIAAMPNFAPAHVFLGDACRHIGQRWDDTYLTRAIAAYESAIRLGTRNTRTAARQALKEIEERKVR